MVSPEIKRRLIGSGECTNPDWADHAADEISLNRAQPSSFSQRTTCPSEMTMASPKNSDQDTGLENISVNSSRRSGTNEDGTGNPAHQNGEHDPTESAKVPDQQISVERSPEIEDTESHPT
jgi:hypothetical protein